MKEKRLHEKKDYMYFMVYGPLRWYRSEQKHFINSKKYFFFLWQNNNNNNNIMYSELRMLKCSKCSCGLFTGAHLEWSNKFNIQHEITIFMYSNNSGKLQVPSEEEII